MKTPTKPELPESTISIGNSGDLSSLRQKTGALKKLDVKWATSRAAGEELKKVQIEQMKAEGNIAFTGVKLGEAAILTAMVANAMPQIGALTTRVNAATTAVDQALTNGNAGETYTHLSNRAANVQLANDLRISGKISSEEAEVVISFAQADAADDVNRSRQRMADAKTAVSSLHEFALKGIAAAKNKLS